MIPIIDAHHHIWRLADLAWLSGPTQPRIFGTYEDIKRDYDISEYLRDLEGNGVTGSVYIQVNWPAGKEIDEAAWVQSIADQYGWPNAIVGYVDFSTEDARATMAALGQFSLLRGIRQQLHWHENPLYKFASSPDLMNEKNWRRNFAHLQDFGWSFDLQVFTSQMAGAAGLARDFPGIPMILQHCGMPEDTSASGMNAWRDGLKRLSDAPNIYCKLSGLGTFIHRNSPDFIAEIAGYSVEAFGPRRCLFGSNFPIEKLWTTYADLIAAYRKALEELPQDSQKAILSGTAKELYNLHTTEK